MLSRRLRFLQLASAALLLPLILLHVGLVLYAVTVDLGAAEILRRVDGSVGWTLYYVLFVVAAAVHGPIGVRNVFLTWTRWRGYSLDLAAWLLMVVLMLLGLRAVAIVTGCWVLMCL